MACLRVVRPPHCRTEENCPSLPQVLDAAQGEAAGGVDAEVLRRLTADVCSELNALRNTAYASGFSAAKVAIMGTINGQYA